MQGRARWRRIGAAGAAALALHLLLAAGLVFTRPKLTPSSVASAPDMMVELARAPAPARASRPSPPTAVGAGAPAPKTAVAAAPAPSPAATLAAPSPAAVVPDPAAAASVAGGADGRWQVRPGGEAVHGFGRGVLDCGRYESLTAAQQEACTRSAGLARAQAVPAYDPVPKEKRAYYDAVVAAYAKMHAPAAPILRAVGGPGSNLVAGERWVAEPGAHMPGFGCHVPLGVPKGWKPSGKGPPHALKLGPLPCYVTPPSGLFTEEADIPSAVDIPKPNKAESR